MRKAELVVLALAVASFFVGSVFYSHLPDRVATHWNSRGEVDGYSSRLFALFFVPILTLGLALLFIAIPRIDPLKANIEKFRKHYDGLIVLVLIFLVVMYLHTILWNLGTKINPNAIVPIGIGLLLFYVGILCENAKRNWFVGVRTPWTLSSDAVWEKTNKLGGKLMKIAGLITIVGIFFRAYVIYFVLIPVLGVAAYTIVYSYLEYQKEQRI